jgi:nitrate reductase gamma subunit
MVLLLQIHRVAKKARAIKEALRLKELEGNLHAYLGKLWTIFMLHLELKCVLLIYMPFHQNLKDWLVDLDMLYKIVDEVITDVFDDIDARVLRYDQ